MCVRKTSHNHNLNASKIWHYTCFVFILQITTKSMHPQYISAKICRSWLFQLIIKFCSELIDYPLGTNSIKIERTKAALHWVTLIHRDRVWFGFTSHVATRCLCPRDDPLMGLTSNLLYFLLKISSVNIELGWDEIWAGRMHCHTAASSFYH